MFDITTGSVQPVADELAILPRAGAFDSVVTPPGSKSITNRALICAALAQGPSELRGALESEDTHVMVAALQSLGVNIAWDRKACKMSVAGSGGEIHPPAAVDISIANSGTSIRFLTSLVAVARGVFRLDGVPRMRERPIGDLLSGLRQLGATVACEQAEGYPPVVVQADGLAGGAATIRGDVSSQFLSGLLMAAPYARNPVTLTIEGPLVSQPYVEMTLRVMESFGIRVERSGAQFTIQPARYLGCEYDIEPDASAASYFLGAAAICRGRVRVQGLSRNSLQGDVAFADVLAQMGCHVEYGTDSVTVTGGELRGIDVNMNAISDTVQTLAAVALYARGTTRVRGVPHMRHKETDRLSALATELRKLGATVEELADGLDITPAPLHGAAIDTYNDHRMAMSLALVGLRTAGVVIRNPGCVAKTYPNYFDDLNAATDRSPA